MDVNVFSAMVLSDETYKTACRTGDFTLRHRADLLRYIELCKDRREKQVIWNAL
jgi:hypothetical protein